MQATYETEDFWSDTYRGRVIAILNHCGRWLVYLDHVLQPRVQFELGGSGRQLVAAQSRPAQRAFTTALSDPARLG